MNCGHCSSPVTEPSAPCATCNAAYHVECFVDNGKCAVYGCESKALKLSDSESILPVQQGTLDTFLARYEAKQHLGMQPDVLAELVCAEMNVDQQTKQQFLSLHRELNATEKKYAGNPVKRAVVGSLAVCFGLEILEHLFFIPDGFGLLPYFAATIFGPYVGMRWKSPHQEHLALEKEAIIQKYSVLLK